ncbi:MAG: hypothetical protein KGI69_02050 [Patescibacteria group bacterium]|nr:hypothetical protein [Patescibacteria group bacterium]
MSYESPEDFMTVKNEGEHGKEINPLQADLAERFYGYRDDQRFLEEWVPKYSVPFRRLIEKEMRANPHLLRDLKDPAMKGEIMDRLARGLYGETDEEEAIESAEEQFDR